MRGKSTISILACAAALSLSVAGCRSPRTVLQTMQTSQNSLAQSMPLIAAANTANTESGDQALETKSASIDELVQIALARNPEIAAAEQRAAAVSHRIPQALALPDPMLNSSTHLAPVQTAAGEQAFALGLSQKIVDADRRATRAAIVLAERKAAELEVAATQLEVSERVRVACQQLLLVQKSIEILREDASSLAELEEVVLRQYEVKASVSQQDVLNIQMEQSQLDNQLTELQQQEKSYEARLARLLHLDSNAKFKISDELVAEQKKWDLSELLAIATQARPELQSQLAKIERADRRVCLAALESRPDYNVGLNWIATSSNGISPVANGDDALLLNIGFNLPIHRARIRAGICEAQAERNASAFELESLQDRVVEEVVDLVSKLKSTQQTLRLLQEDILPKAVRTLEMSIDEYSLGRTDYVQLIQNWRSLLKYRITEANLQSQANQLAASLTRATGQLQFPANPTATAE